MVKVVYNTGRRISVDPKVTVGRAIEMVADAADHKYCCIFFNDQQLDNATVINQIPGLKDHHTLRVICAQHTQLNLPRESPSVDEILRCLTERMTENEYPKIIKFVESANFKQILLGKFPALLTDVDLIPILSDHVLWFQLLEKKDEQFLKDHPLFVPALYAILGQVFNQDTMNRLFLNQQHAPPEQLFSAANLNQLINFLPTPTVRAQQNAASNIGTRRVPPITRAMFADALQMLEGGGSSQSSESSNATVPLASSAQNPTENLLEIYAEQIATLHEYGFTNDDENILALTEASGVIELALEIIIRNREDES